MRAVIQKALNARNMGLVRYIDRPRLRRLVRSLHPVVTHAALMRVGGDGDGGYLVPDDLDGVTACFSPGVDRIASFEQAIADRGIPCFLADASVEEVPVDDDRLHFDKKFLGVWNDDLMITLETWVNLHAPGGGDLILQIDIEGAEWPVILNVPDYVLDRFRIIVIEVHSFNKMLEVETFPLLETALTRLTRKFHVVHNHPNNVYGEMDLGDIKIPRLFELTLLRKDRADAIRYAVEFPNTLDQTNVPALPDIILPPQWYGGSLTE